MRRGRDGYFELGHAATRLRQSNRVLIPLIHSAGKKKRDHTGPILNFWRRSESCPGDALNPPQPYSLSMWRIQKANPEDGWVLSSKLVGRPEKLQRNQRGLLIGRDDLLQSFQLVFMPGFECGDLALADNLQFSQEGFTCDLIQACWQ